MDLLNGFISMDFDHSVGGGNISDLALDTSNNSIQFSAAAFDGMGLVQAHLHSLLRL